MVQALKSDKNSQFYERKRGDHIFMYFYLLWVPQAFLNEINLNLNFGVTARKIKIPNFLDEISKFRSDSSPARYYLQISDLGGFCWPMAQRAAACGGQGAA